MNARMKAITNAATSLFLRQGYAKTQISHIAKAAGISVGTIYHDFAGKQEILHYMLKCIIDPDFIGKELERPVSDVHFKHLEDEIISVLLESETDFSRHLDTNDSYHFEDMISDAFDLMARYAAGNLFIEKNQYDVPLLAEQYKLYRRKFFDNSKQYVSRFIENGTVRPLAHLELSVTMIIEILSWWAMDRRFLSFDMPEISLELAKEICLDTILPAFKTGH